MKIAYFLDVPKGLGGAGNLLLNQAVLMSKLHDVIVVIPEDENGEFNTEYASRCSFYKISYVCIKYVTAYNFALIDFAGSMDSIDAIESFARTEKIEFFHSVQLNLAVEYVSRKLGIPHLMNIYQLSENEFSVCPEGICPKYHLCDSLLYSDIWHKQIGIKSKCIRPVAILEKMKMKTEYAKDKIVILMLGAVCPRKNQLAAIKAFSLSLDYCKMELHIAGECNDSYSEQCKDYVKKNNLSKHVFFHGFVSDITPMLENSDCLLCSSLDESFPSSIVEALTYDLTIISTPVAGVPEVFIDKNNSFISRDFSEESIKDSIIECIEYYRNGRISDIHMAALDTWKTNFERNMVRKSLDSYYMEIKADNYYNGIEPFIEIKQPVKDIQRLLDNWKDYKENPICNKRALYYSFIRKNFDNRKVYIWGAGKLGANTLDILRRICHGVNVEAFIDRHKEGDYCGLPIIKLEDVPFEKNNVYCISFALGSGEAVRYLEEKGLVLYKQIWIMP